MVNELDVRKKRVFLLTIKIKSSRVMFSSTGIVMIIQTTIMIMQDTFYLATV